jgi:membrane protease YdiL (CAAX protease family)
MSNYFRKLHTINQNDFLSLTILLFFIKSISVGFLEEITFRSLFQSLILRKYYLSHGIYVCVAISSLMFGLGHLINLGNANYSLIGVFSQVVMASCIGFFFGSLLIATQSVYPAVLIHSLNHFSTFITELFPQYYANNVSSRMINSSTLEIIGSSVITLLIFGLPTILPSIYILNRFKPTY